MEKIFDELIENIIMIDECEKIVFMNKILYEVMGYKKEELDKDKLSEVVKINKEEALLICKDNTIINAKCKLIESNVIERSYKVGILSWEKYLEEKELIMKNYKKLEVLRNEFFANLSHELRTPLTIIMSITQILDKTYEFENDINNLKIKSSKYLNILKQNTYRLLRMINNLIDVTKIDAGFYKINLINANIVYLIEEIVMSVAEYCNMKGITLIFNTEVEEEIIACDPDQIERIILNLLSNAAKYTPSNGHIYVDLKVEKEFIFVSVEDTGDGILQEKINYIFDRFVQCDKKDENRVDGSGIGLSLTKSLVEMHGGNIKVKSVKGKGSKFIFTLPRVKLDDEKVYDDMELDSNDSRLERCNIEFSDIYSL